jgi:hypothetical protein
VKIGSVPVILKGENKFLPFSTILNDLGELWCKRLPRDVAE